MEEKQWKVASGQLLGLAKDLKDYLTRFDFEARSRAISWYVFFFHIWL
jgi:hypothetical protein